MYSLDQCTVQYCTSMSLLANFSEFSVKTHEKLYLQDQQYHADLRCGALEFYLSPFVTSHDSPSLPRPCANSLEVG